MNNYKVIKGDTTKSLIHTIVGLPTLDSNWNCDIEVLENLIGAVPIISRSAVKKDDNSSFYAFLTPVETDTLIVDKRYYWVTKIYNSTLSPAYHKTTINTLLIEAGGD